MHRRKIMMGDYVPGYGDGFLGGIGHFIGGLGKAAVSTGIGFLTGGPAGAVVGAAKGFGGMTAARSHEALVGAGGTTSAYTPTMAKRHALIVANAKRMAITHPIGSLPTGTPHGLHAHGVHLLGAGGGRRRRINPLNIKALRRADRRARSFLHAVRNAVAHFMPHKHKGKAYVHFKKRRAK